MAQPMNAKNKAKAQNSSSSRAVAVKKEPNSIATNCSPSPEMSQGQRKSHKSANTKIVVKCNCGFTNNLYLRGEGIRGLSWDKGTLMKCTKADEWIWETDSPFNHAKIKVVLNDKQYEIGENHEVDCGRSITFSPRF